MSTVQVGIWGGSNDSNHVCVNHRALTSVAADWIELQDALDFRRAMYCCDYIGNYTMYNGDFKI